ncbi:MAG: alanine--glyoxylate aminotransferase family protein [Gammaproteobacteria bacterium]|nr:alanine--glyoxylate aminotransferase family protein [Gammaproteobacteria bacterium]
MPIGSFHPPLRTLMGPGPSNVDPRVLEAMSRPTIGHLDPLFITLMDEIKTLLKYAFQTQNELTLPISGPGSVGMETCFVNLVEPGDKVIVCQNGAFGGRMRENVIRCGGTAVMVEDNWGDPVDPQKLEDALNSNPDARIVAFVHAETSTGATSDAASLVELAHGHDCLTIVDAVTSLGGTALKVDEWQIDAVYSGTQKCLSAPPGLSPVSFNERAKERIRTRKSKVQSWFMDLNLIMEYWGAGSQRTYHHTAPVNSLYALHEALILLQNEGLENAWTRHQNNHKLLLAGLEAMGLSLLVEKSHRLPQLNSVRIPQGVDEAEARKTLLKDYNLEIGAGLGPLAGKIWRIGLMGRTSTSDNVMLCLRALDEVLTNIGADINSGRALSAAQGV